MPAAPDPTPALRTLAELLARYRSPLAQPLEDWLSRWPTDAEAVRAEACGDLLWSDDDGLWDTGPQVLQRIDDDTDACRQDELAYRAAFADLADALAPGAATWQASRMREVVATFRAWTDEGL